MSNLLELQDVTIKYGQIAAVRGISLAITAGEVVALIGPNGAGKTTLVSGIAGLLKPSRGSIRYRDTAISGLPAYDVLDLGLSLIPQGRQIFADMSVVDNLLLGAYRTRDRQQRTDMLEKMLERFPILRQLGHLRAGALSGGQQQMLTIARALMAQPQLLMFDEPSLGLAPKVVEEVGEIITEISAEGTTVILVEQNVAMALDIAARAYVLESGELVDHGTSQELLQRESIRTAYLGV